MDEFQGILTTATIEAVFEDQVQMHVFVLTRLAEVGKRRIGVILRNFSDAIV